MATLERRTALIKARVHLVMHRHAKIRATAQGKSMQQYIEDLVREDLGDEELGGGEEVCFCLASDLAGEVLVDAQLRRAARELTELTGHSADPLNATAVLAILSRHAGALDERETVLRYARGFGLHARAEREIRVAMDAAEESRK